MAAELADSYSWLASARATLGELAGAERLYAQEMAVVQTLRARFPGESMWIYREVRALHHRAAIGVALGLDARALRDYTAAHDLFAPVVAQDRANRAWQVELAALEQDRLRILARQSGGAAVLAPLAAVQHTFRELLDRDPKNAAWMRREALARLRLLAAAPVYGPAQQAELDEVLASLNALHASNPADLNSRQILIEALLFTPPAPALTQARLKCRQAYGMISREAVATNDYDTLDPWVRINGCLGDLAPARAAMRRLHAIGYRDTQYLQYIGTLGAQAHPPDSSH